MMPTFNVDDHNNRVAAKAFLDACGIVPTPDAVDQLVQVFLPCLGIMCSRPWSPDGSTWRRSGIFGAMTDAKKKWERFWERTWKHGERHDDSGLDLINYIGFVMRSYPDSGWGEWGPPSVPESEARVSWRDVASSMPTVDQLFRDRYPPGDEGSTLDHIPPRTRAVMRGTGAAMAAEAGCGTPGPEGRLPNPPETPEARARKEARIRGEDPALACTHGPGCPVHPHTRLRPPSAAEWIHDAGGEEKLRGDVHDGERP